MGSWGENLGPRAMRMGSEEDSTIRNITVCSLNIVRVIESRSVRWAGHIDRMEDGTNAFKMFNRKELCYMVVKHNRLQ